MQQDNGVPSRPSFATGGPSDDAPLFVTSGPGFGAAADAAPSPAPQARVGVVRGPVGGDAILVLGTATPPEAVEFRRGADSFLPTAAEPTPGDPLLEINQIIDPDFSDGLDRWQPTGKRDGWATGLDHFGWYLRDSHTAFMRQDLAKVAGAMELAYDSGHPGGLIPLRPGAQYQFSALLAAHRCRGAIVVQVQDAKGAVLTEAEGKPAPEAVGGEEPEGYDRVVVQLTAPAVPCFARLLLRKGPTEFDSDSWFFFAQLSFARVRDRTPLGFVVPPYGAEEIATLQQLDVDGARLLRVALPPGTGKVDAVDRATGLPLVGSPLSIGQPLQLAGAITGLEGSTVLGWARDVSHPNIPIQVRLFVDGQEVGDMLADQPHGDSRSGFRFPLPTSVLDGQVHWLSLRLRSDQVVAEAAEILPASLTPWPALARYGSVRLPARLSTAAAYRYEALREHIEATLRAGAKGPAADAALANLGQLMVAHERVLAGIDRKVTLPPLAFPVHATPRVSVVIPVHNKLEVTHNCLAALLLAWNATSFEVIVADDGSTDGTTEIEELVSGITVCRNETAEGFVSACNLGASKARGEYVVLLNNDTEPTTRWLDELLHVFDNFDDVGLAGSKLIYPDGRLQEAGGIIWGNGTPWNYGRLGNAADPKYCYTRQADYVSGASLMMPTALWKKLGGLSEEFRPAYYEDTDLAFKVRDAGLRVVYAPHSVVFHFEGISNGTSTSSGLKRFQEVNRPKFLRKWRTAYRHNGTEQTLEHADLEKDRGIGLRALFIDAQTPRPDQDAGSYAAVQEIRAMQALGAKVTFLPENLAFLAGYTTDLQRAGVETIYAPFASSVEDFLARRGREFDIVYITRYMVADRHLDVVRRHAPQAKILFCNADLHFLRELREAIRLKDPAKIAGAVATREAELRVMRGVDVTLSYNPVEHAVILSHNLDSTKVATAPWIVDVAEDIPRFAARSGIAFLGGFGHPPNAEAVQFFVREVMPLLRQKLPGVPFLIYGSSVPPEIERLEADDVVVKGFVPHVAEVFETCRVFVAPLLSGAGVKGKVVDALSFGVPSVLSPIAAEGIGIGEGAEAMVARTPAEWVAAIATLHADEKAWTAMSDRARAYARRVYSFEAGVEHMRVAVETAGLFPDAGMAPKRARLGL